MKKSAKITVAVIAVLAVAAICFVFVQQKGKRNSAPEDVIATVENTVLTTVDEDAPALPLSPTEAETQAEAGEDVYPEQVATTGPTSADATTVSQTVRETPTEKTTKERRGLFATTTKETTAKATTTKATPATTTATPVVKPGDPKGTYTLTVKGDKGTSRVLGGGSYKAGTQVTVSANLLLGNGVKQWTSSVPSLLPNGGSGNSYSFKMPAANVQLTAVTYSIPTVKVKAGTGIAAVSEDKSYTLGQTATVVCKVKDGYDFVGWTSNPSGITGDTLQLSFVVPDHNVTMTATAKPRTYLLRTQKSKGVKTLVGTGLFKVDAKVTIVATLEDGYKISKWEGIPAGATVSGNRVTFNMPAEELIVQPITEKLNYYKVILDKQTGIRSVSGDGDYAPGDKVSISCNVESGYSFDCWSPAMTSALNGSLSQTYSFTMPKGDVVLTACVKPQDYRVTLNKGSEGILSVSGQGTYTAGTMVTVSCRVAEGYVFSEWSSDRSDFNGHGMNSYSFIMPDHPVSLTAIVRPK